MEEEPLPQLQNLLKQVKQQICFPPDGQAQPFDNSEIDSLSQEVCQAVCNLLNVINRIVQ